MERLYDLYAAGKTNRLRWDDQWVFGMCRLTVQGRFSIRFLESIAEPPQGVRIFSKNKMSIGNAVSKEFAVWSEDASKFEVELLVRNPQEIRISNIWRYRNGQIQSWYGNYGMLVEREGSSVDFRCSDGRNHPTFDDLHFVVDGVLDTEPLE